MLRGRLLRVMRTVDMIANTTAEDAIKRQMMRVFSVVVVVLVISTGFVQYLANEMAGENWIGIKTRCSFPDADVCGGLCTPAASANANGCITIKRFGEPSLYSCTFLAGGCHPNPNPNPNPDPGPEDGSATRPRAGPRKSKTPTAATRWTSMSRSTSPSSRSPRSGNAASLSPLAPPRARAPQLGARRYGDITPVSALSKMVMIVLVCFTAYAIPNQVLPAPALSRQRRPRRPRARPPLTPRRRRAARAATKAAGAAGAAVRVRRRVCTHARASLCDPVLLAGRGRAAVRGGVLPRGPRDQEELPAARPPHQHLSLPEDPPAPPQGAPPPRPIQ